MGKVILYFIFIYFKFMIKTIKYFSLKPDVSLHIEKLSGLNPIIKQFNRTTTLIDDQKHFKLNFYYSFPK